MNKVRAFINESIEEIRTNVTWPARNELINNSLLVLVASVIFALVIGVIDAGFKYVMDSIYSL